MKRLMIAAAALLTCACTPPATEEVTENPAEPALPGVTLPVADQAGNRMEELTQNGGRWCTADGAWCATPDTVSVALTHNGESAGTIAIGEPQEGQSTMFWPVIVRVGRNDESALLGVSSATSTMYSGGGGNASQLVLYSVEAGVVHEAVRMPLSASSTVRACFDEGDEAQRAGACHDEYRFVTRISLDEGVAEGAPRIMLETAAGSYPGRVTRDADSLEAPALTEADLVWAQDPICSYRRTYSRGADGLYVPDQPLPPCSDYLEP
ncbi:MAG: hypothetical protein R3C27_05315 [Hyphomonadaceae bacterium]